MPNKGRPTVSIPVKRVEPAPGLSPTSTISSTQTSPPQTPEDFPWDTSRSASPQIGFSAKWNLAEGKLSYSDRPSAPQLKGPAKLSSGKPASSRPTRANADREPFAILGSRNPYYIGLPSPHEYDRFIRGRGQDVGHIQVKKINSDTSLKSSAPKDRKLPVTAPLRVTKHTPSLSKVPASVPPHGRSRMLSADNNNESKRRPPPKRFATLPESRSYARQKEPGTPSSTLTFAAVWDPREGISTFRGRMLFDESSKQVVGSSVDALPILNLSHLNHPLIVDQFSNAHPDCEPHLTSRFSTTTTSTSNYVDIDFSDIPAPENAHLQTWNEDHSSSPTPAATSSGEPSTKLSISSPFLLLPHSPPRSSTPRARAVPALNASGSSKFLPLTRSKSAPARRRSDRQASTPASLSRAVSPTGNGASSSSASKRPGLGGVLGKFKPGRRNSEQRDDGWVSIEICE